MKKSRPIFDSLCHPKMSGKWEGRTEFLDSSFSHLVNQMKLNNVVGGVASFYPASEEESFAEFMRQCNFYEKSNLPLVIKPCHMIREQFDITKQRILDCNKYTTQDPLFLKFHPHYCSPRSYLEKASRIKEQFKNKKIVWYVCTYPFCTSRSLKRIDFGDILQNLAEVVGDDPLVMLHGGTIELLKYSQYAQHFKNVFLDLSFTICRYINSSLIYDMAYLFEYLDQKIIIGTDHPEYSYSSLRESLERIESLLDMRINKDLISKKLDNIYYKNMTTLLMGSK